MSDEWFRYASVDKQKTSIDKCERNQHLIAKFINMRVLSWRLQGIGWNLKKKITINVNFRARPYVLKVILQQMQLRIAFTEFLSRLFFFIQFYNTKYQFSINKSLNFDSKNFSLLLNKISVMNNFLVNKTSILCSNMLRKYKKSGHPKPM